MYNTLITSINNFVNLAKTPPGVISHNFHIPTIKTQIKTFEEHKGEIKDLNAEENNNNIIRITGDKLEEYKNSLRNFSNFLKGMGAEGEESLNNINTRGRETIVEDVVNRVLSNLNNNAQGEGDASEEQGGGN